MKFQAMHKLIPENELETHKIIHRTPTKFEVMRQKMNFMRDGLSHFDHNNRTVAMLVKKNKKGYPDQETVMSDSTMEWQSNSEIVEKAHGDVLIGGLGIGMILLPILKKPEVTSVTVVELYQDVISLVYPFIEKQDTKKKLTVICNDINKMDYFGEKKFNVIYFDIWNNICTDNWEQIKALKRTFRKFLKKEDPAKYIGAWMEDELRYLIKRDSR